MCNAYTKEKRHTKECNEDEFISNKILKYNYKHPRGVNCETKNSKKLLSQTKQRTILKICRWQDKLGRCNESPSIFVVVTIMLLGN